ncbi:MAG: hypothetical protein AMJ91_03875 [candidate division Zixibacteria bacterium SM23_73_3]|nr:MAG: hypothetical protein AMJ91_03875 [candidate division Zixibacteria bacterium SM23_73_3]
MKKISVSLVIFLLLLFANGFFVYGQVTHDVDIGGPCPPYTPDPKPGHLIINDGDFVRFHTSLSCDFWVRGPAPIGQFRLGGVSGDYEETVGPFNLRYEHWNYWVVNTEAEPDSVAGLITARGIPTLTQLGVIILMVLIVGSGVFIMLRRKKAMVSA